MAFRPTCFELMGVNSHNDHKLMSYVCCMTNEEAAQSVSSFVLHVCGQSVFSEVVSESFLDSVCDVGCRSIYWSQWLASLIFLSVILWIKIDFEFLFYSHRLPWGVLDKVKHHKAHFKHNSILKLRISTYSFLQFIHTQYMYNAEALYAWFIHTYVCPIPGKRHHLHDKWISWRHPAFPLSSFPCGYYLSSMYCHVV